jgi:hypothetical protein
MTVFCLSLPATTHVIRYLCLQTEALPSNPAQISISYVKS